MEGMSLEEHRKMYSTMMTRRRSALRSQGYGPAPRSRRNKKEAKIDTIELEQRSEVERSEVIAPEIPGDEATAEPKGDDSGNQNKTGPDGEDYSKQWSEKEKIENWKSEPESGQIGRAHV